MSDKLLMEHAKAIAVLQERADESDRRFGRLDEAMEKLDETMTIVARELRDMRWLMVVALLLASFMAGDKLGLWEKFSVLF